MSNTQKASGRCRHILSVPRESLANTILLVSAMYLLVLIITGVRSIHRGPACVLVDL